MPGERNGNRSLAGAVAATDWTQYTGQASYVKRRGERRRRGLQAGAALGTTFAVVGVAVAVHGFGGGPAAQRGVTPAGSPTTGASPRTSSSYPEFPKDLPKTPKLVADPGKVLSSGVIGAGTISGHTWQIAYRVVPSASAANASPEVTMTDATLDGKTINLGGSSDPHAGGGGYSTLDKSFRNTGVGDPVVFGSGTPSPGVTSVDLRWKNGTVVQVPIRTVRGAPVASFAWDPANPPEALEQVRPTGVQKITISDDGMGIWMTDPRRATKVATPPPVVVTPSGAPNLSQTPHVTPHSSGILGAGTVAGHPWQIAYEIIPSGSSGNSSDEVFCTDTTVDGTTTQGGCTSAKPFGVAGELGFNYHEHGQAPFATGYGAAPAGTTAIGFEWADGTRTANAVQDVEGVPMAALAFDPAHPPSYVLEVGPAGTTRISLAGELDHVWTFHWPNG